MRDKNERKVSSMSRTPFLVLNINFINSFYFFIYDAKDECKILFPLKFTRGENFQYITCKYNSDFDIPSLLCLNLVPGFNIFCFEGPEVQPTDIAFQEFKTKIR